MKVKDARRFWGVVSAALLISCHIMSPAGAGVLPVLVESMPTSGKVDLTCAANGECAGSINLGTDYTLHSVTCLAAAAEFFYGYADISIGSAQTRTYISPNHVSPRYYWLNSWRYVTMNQDIEQPAERVSFHMNLGNGFNIGGGEWAQCYATASRSFEVDWHFDRHPHHYYH